MAFTVKFSFNSVTGSDLNERSSGNDKNIELQQLHLKLERDHRYSSELLRRSLTAAPEQSKIINVYKVVYLQN